MADTRYAFLALPFEMQELGYPKEIMVDYETGHIYIKSIDGFTNLGKTKELEDLIKQLKSDGGDLIYVTIDGENSQLLNIVLRNIFMNLSTINADLENKIDVSKIGVANGVAPLDENKVIPISYLPNEIKEIIIVNNIAERNSIPNANKFRGLNVYVTDATGDTTVTSGGAYYLWDGVKWIKTSESESLDIVLRWGNISEIPFATTAEAESGINDTNIMTPLKVRRAILAMGGSGGGSGRNVYINGISEWQYTAATTNRNIVVPSAIYDPAKAFIVVSYDGLDAFENVDYVINGNTVTLSFNPVIGVIIRFLIFKISYEYRDLAGLPDIATLAQAEAGTNDTALMTPLKTKNAINKLKHEYKHTVSEISNFPTSLPANGGNTDSVGNKTANGVPSTLEKTDIIKMINELYQKITINGEVGGNVLELTSSGTWTVPQDVYKINVFLCGGGGAGASNSNNGIGQGEVQSGGGGGGGGLTAYYEKISVTPGQTIPFIIGAGGSYGNYDEYNPKPGGTTTFLTYNASGGNPGITAGKNSPGSGGTGSGKGGNGGNNSNGENGMPGITCPINRKIYGSGGGGGGSQMWVYSGSGGGDKYYNYNPGSNGPGDRGIGGQGTNSIWGASNGLAGIVIIQY